MTVGILRRAIESAKRSTMYPYRIGCVCFRGKKILSCGFNQKRTSRGLPDKFKKYIETLHAEQHAILRIKNKELLNGAALLVIRITRSGKLTMARPCNNCIKAIKSYGIKYIWFSNGDGEIIREKME